LFYSSKSQLECSRSLCIRSVLLVVQCASLLYLRSWTWQTESFIFCCFLASHLKVPLAMGLRLCRGLSKFVSQIRKTPLVKHKVGATDSRDPKGQKTPLTRKHTHFSAALGLFHLSHEFTHRQKEPGMACLLTTATFKHTKDTTRSTL